MPEPITARETEIVGFLAAAGWGDAARAPLAGDASARRYERLTRRGATAILMDAPGQAAATEAFLRVGDWLRARGYSAPRTWAARPDLGLLLIEDLGDALFARLMASDPASEKRLYSGAISFLADLHRHSAPGFVAPLDGRALGDLVGLTLEWYPAAVDHPLPSAAGRIAPLIAEMHDRLAVAPPVLCLRDLHAENLVLLPGRTPPADVGLLDYQDAVAAQPAYDLVSLLQDARRDLARGLEQAMIARYADLAGCDPALLAPMVALLGAQRQIRILGVFTRLCLRDGKTGYLAHLPRVWRHLERNLAHPALAALADAVSTALPAPTPARIERIASLCATAAHR